MKKPALIAATAAAMLLSLAACGGGSVSGDPAQTQEESGLTTLKVGFVPAASAGALQLGMDKGIFARHGFKLELTQGTGGAALLPAVTSGSLDLAVGHPISVLTAQDKGLDMKIVAGYGYSPEDRPDSNGVVALEGSGIETPLDLAGKTVSVNTINGPGDLTIKETITKKGGNPDEIKFTEMHFQDAQAQLERGNADAIWLSEPFLTNAINAGHHLVTSPYAEAVPQQSTQLVFTSEKWAAENADVIEKFQPALNEVLDYATENEDELREVLPDFIRMDPGVADKVIIEDLDAEVRRDSLQQFAELMAKYGYTKSTVAVSQITAG